MAAGILGQACASQVVLQPISHGDQTLWYPVCPHSMAAAATLIDKASA